MAVSTWLWLRLVLLIAGGAMMAAGLYGGLVRLGLDLPVTTSAAMHGPLMIAGVFGTLISLERAVAMRVGWAYLAPILSIIGGAALLAGLPVQIGGVLFMASALVFLTASLWITVMQPVLFTALLALGAAAAGAGNVVWLLTGSVPDAAAWWVCFLVFTIAAERLELSRILGHGRAAGVMLCAILAVALAGAGLGLPSVAGRALLGMALVALALWLTRYDIATRTVRQPGRTRFFAVAMLAGYAWLAVAGLVLLLGSAATFGYDALLHAVLIGFVLSMVFGHALIILPAVGGLRLRYHGALYAPLALLHLSAVMRVAGGLAEIDMLRLASGPLTVLALLGFAGTIVVVSRG